MKLIREERNEYTEQRLNIVRFVFLLDHHEHSRLNLLEMVDHLQMENR